MYIYKTMLRIPVVCCCFLLLTCTVKAQDASHENGSRLGLKAGINIANLAAQDVTANNAIPGFNGGVFLKVALPHHFAFQPELLFSTQGAELEYNNDYVTGSATYHLNYLQVPLLGVYNFTQNVNVQAGIYLASLLSANIKNGSNANSINFEEEMSKSNFQSLDYGFIAGVGGDIDRISFGARYIYGASNIGKDFTFPDEQTRTFPDAHNIVWQVYFGLSIL